MIIADWVLRCGSLMRGAVQNIGSDVRLNDDEHMYGATSF